MVLLWSLVKERLKGHAKLKVAKALVELGFSVKNGRIYCGPVEVPSSRLAKAIGVDRRIVTEAINAIENDPQLKEIFEGIEPAGPSFRRIAKKLGFGIIEIEADPKKPGIIAGVTSIIAKKEISIRQVIADDPELYPNPKLTVITEKEVPGELIPLFLKVEGVKKVTVY